MDHIELFKNMQGYWEGTCRTWFGPDNLVDESAVAGELMGVLGNRFLRHTYKGSMKGKPRSGEELIAFNPVIKKYQVTWVDDFHMNAGILFSEGGVAENGFTVLGRYDTGEHQPQWGWKTEYSMPDHDRLMITAYNIEPSGEETKAVETAYRRVG